MECAVKDNRLILPANLSLTQKAVMLFVGDTVKLYTLKAWEDYCERVAAIEDNARRKQILRILMSTSHNVDNENGALIIPGRRADDGEVTVSQQEDFLLIEGIVWNTTREEGEE